MGLRSRHRANDPLASPGRQEQSRPGNRLHRIIFVTSTLVLSLASGFTLIDKAQLALAARQAPSPQQKSARKSNKVLTNIDPNRVVAKPNPTPAPQRRPLQLIVVNSQQPPRIGEEVKFSVGPANLLREYAPLTINFGDGATASNAENNPAGITHRYTKDSSYSVAVFKISPRGQPFQLSDFVGVSVGTWSLNASATEVEIGQPVTFAIDRPAADRGISYRFYFRDSQPADWVSDAEQPHSFYLVGPHRAAVEIGLVVDGSTQRIAGAQSPEVNVKPLTGVVLNVDRSSIRAGEEVSLTTRLESKFLSGDRNLRYKFLYDDGSPNRWQSEPDARHPFLSTGDHIASVQVGYQYAGSNATPIIGESVPIRINVTPATAGNQNSPTRNGNSSDGAVTNSKGRGGQGSKDYADVIIATIAALFVIAILVAGYQTMKGRFSVKPDYRVHRDIGIGLMSGASLAIEFGIHLKPDVIDARYQLDMPEAGFIRYERRQVD